MDGSVFNPSGMNIIEYDSCNASSDPAHFIVGDAKLGSYGKHGGSTMTFSLLAGSPAINQGDNAICAAAPINNLDQRGVIRPQGTQCDIGAFEKVLAPKP